MHIAVSESDSRCGVRESHMRAGSHPGRYTVLLRNSSVIGSLHLGVNVYLRSWRLFM